MHNIWSMWALGSASDSFTKGNIKLKSYLQHISWYRVLNNPDTTQNHLPKQHKHRGKVAEQSKLPCHWQEQTCLYAKSMASVLIKSQWKSIAQACSWNSAMTVNQQTNFTNEQKNKTILYFIFLSAFVSVEHISCSSQIMHLYSVTSLI